jgi:hypothetical protein
LLRSLLSRHPSISICAETRFFADIYRRRSTFGSLENIENRTRLVDQYLATAWVTRFHVDLPMLRQRLLDEAVNYPAFFDTLIRFDAESHHKPRCGEKTPHHSFCTELLSEWYPGAFLIHLVRDPRDVVASLQRMPWSPKSVWTNSWIWALFNRAAERSRHRPGYLLVQYEQLIASPQQELQRICAHVGEEWPDSLDVPVEAQEQYSWPHSATGAITRTRVQKWREQLSPRDVSVIERIAGKRLKAYGYEPSGDPASAAAMTKALAQGAFDQARQRVSQLPHTWFYVTQPTNLPLHEYWKYRHAWDKMFPNRPRPGGRK